MTTWQGVVSVMCVCVSVVADKAGWDV